MKIIETDNFCGDYLAEHFLGIVSEEDGNRALWFNEQEAKQLVDILNERGGENSPRYWRVVPDDYKLSPGFQP